MATLLAMKTAIDNDLEERTNEIWRQVRENRDSLDSERYCRLMREAMEAATVAVYDKLEPLFHEVDDLKHKLSAARASAKADRAAHEAVAKSLQEYKDKVSKLRRAAKSSKTEAVREIELDASLSMDGATDDGAAYCEDLLRKIRNEENA